MMHIGVWTLILSVATWFGKVGTVGWWENHKQEQQTKIELAKDLCQNHGDCEVQKAIAMKGIRKK